MKLKYLVTYKDRYLFANSLEDLAYYYNVTLSGIRYKIKHKLIDVQNMYNVELHNLIADDYKYSIDKFGVVTVMRENVDKNVAENVAENVDTPLDST